MSRNDGRQFYDVPLHSMNFSAEATVRVNAFDEDSAYVIAKQCMHPDFAPELCGPITLSERQ